MDDTEITPAVPEEPATRGPSLVPNGIRQHQTTGSRRAPSFPGAQHAGDRLSAPVTFWVSPGQPEQGGTARVPTARRGAVPLFSAQRRRAVFGRPDLALAEG